MALHPRLVEHPQMAALDRLMAALRRAVTLDGLSAVMLLTL
jgi:hypothetical protein